MYILAVRCLQVCDCLAWPRTLTAGVLRSQRRNMQTDVSVYLGDCTGDSLTVVCDGTCIEPSGSTWQRALHALAEPSPRGPYAVSNRFTLFVHETHLDAAAGHRLLASYRVDVRCEGKFACFSVRAAQSETGRARVPYLIGDDVVTTARRILKAAASMSVT